MMRQIGTVRAYDTAPERALAFAERMQQSLGLTVKVSDSVAAAVEAADMVLAATWARTPFILPGMLQAGTHVSTIGSDEPGKCEVSAEVIHNAVFVCDDRDLAVSMGAIGARSSEQTLSARNSAKSSAAHTPGASTRSKSPFTAASASLSRTRWRRGRSTGRRYHEALGARSTSSLSHGGSGFPPWNTRIR